MGNGSRRATLIFNPNAGVDNWRHNIDDLAVFWRTHGWSITVRATQRPGHATDLACEAARGGEALVLAAGGDGTIHEAAGALVHTDTILAPLPAGTANCLARDSGHPPALASTPHAICSGCRSSCSTARCTSWTWGAATATTRGCCGSGSAWTGTS